MSDDLWAAIKALQQEVALLKRFEVPQSSGNNSPCGTISVSDYGALGDGISDDTAAINAAIAQAVITGYGQNRPGRISVCFRPKGVYKITSPINLCDLQGITLDGGADQGGAVIRACCAGKAAFEIIGSQSVELRNMEIWGDITDTPALAIWVSRSNTPNGYNSAQVSFTNIWTYGYFTKAIYYGLETESNFFENCTFNVYGGGLDAVFYASEANVLALTPDHTTLLGGGYGGVLSAIRNSVLVMDGSVSARCLYLRGSGGLAMKNVYLYSPTLPHIEIDGSCSLNVEDSFTEGSPDKIVQLTARGGYTNNPSLLFKNFGFGTPTAYTIYADNNVTLKNSCFIACVPGLIVGSDFAPIRLYIADACDFTGLMTNDSRIFNINFDGGGYCIRSKFWLGEADTLTFTGGSWGNANMILDTSTATGWLEMDVLGGFKAGSSAWNYGHLILGTYHLYVGGDGKLYIKNGAPAFDGDGTVVGTQS